jgi:hypothetical protein
MQVLENQFKELLIQALTNENEAAREIAQETAIKVAGNFTESRLKELIAEFSKENIENRWYADPISGVGQNEIGANPPLWMEE